MVLAGPWSHPGHDRSQRYWVLEVKFAFSAQLSNSFQCDQYILKPLNISHFSINFFIFTPRHLKIKFAFCDLIRQLPLGWYISPESYKYSPFFDELFQFHTKAFENEIRIFWPN
jgi:hypothetical protein